MSCINILTIKAGLWEVKFVLHIIPTNNKIGAMLQVRKNCYGDLLNDSGKSIEYFYIDNGGISHIIWLIDYDLYMWLNDKGANSYATSVNFMVRVEMKVGDNLALFGDRVDQSDGYAGYGNKDGSYIQGHLVKRDIVYDQE